MGFWQKLAWELGFGPNLGWELGFGTPLHDPPVNMKTYWRSWYEKDGFVFFHQYTLRL